LAAAIFRIGSREHERARIGQDGASHPVIELWIRQCEDEEQRIREQRHTERQCQTAAMKAGSSPHRLFEAFSAIIAKRRNAEARRKIGLVSPISVDHCKKIVVTTNTDSRCRLLNEMTALFGWHIFWGW